MVEPLETEIPALPKESRQTPNAMRLRGAFFNTEAALCSIFESGRQVYGCLRMSEKYSLDYIELGDIDLDSMRAGRGIVYRKDSSHFGKPQPKYDFWVVNFHHLTMASHIPADSIAGLTGLKYAMVLEVEPHDPLAMMPKGVFDGFIVLDPSVRSTGIIHSFPRPLNGRPRRPRGDVRSIPVIGSFGMGTPGKGFEQVIDAVNREFDRALVRINVPSATYADQHMAGIHGRPYALFLRDLCRNVAKPGIEVEFTREFYGDDALIDWCAANDLNVFLYTRRQSGLSATTDQAILSGQPLAISSNDTFRHIHAYLDPYPVIGLREALTNGATAVALMQQDWSPEAFAARFEQVIGQAGLLAPRAIGPAIASSVHEEEPQQIAHQSNWEKASRRLLVVRDDKTEPFPELSVETAYSKALSRVPALMQCQVVSARRDELCNYLAWNMPLLAFAFSAKTVTLIAEAVRFARVAIPRIALISSETVAPDVQSKIALQFALRPTVPYFTSADQPLPGLPQISIVGFGAPDSNLEDIILKIQREIGGAIVNVALMKGQRKGVEERLGALHRQTLVALNITWNMVELPTTQQSLVSYFGRHRLIVIAGERSNYDTLLGIAQYALILERPVVFTRAARFAEFAGDEPLIEQYSIPELLHKGPAAQVGLIAAYSEGRSLAHAIALFDQLEIEPEERDSADTAGLGNYRAALDGGAPTPNCVLDSSGSAFYRQLAADHSVPQANAITQPNEGGPPVAFHVEVQRGFLMRAVRRICRRAQREVLLLGDTNRPVVGQLRRSGYQLTSLDMAQPSQTFDALLSTTALQCASGARETLSEAVGRLKSGGGGAFTFFYRDLSTEGDERLNPDFPSITCDEMMSIVEGLPIVLIGLPSWRLVEPMLVLDPFAAPPLATLLFTKRGENPLEASQ